MLFLLQKFKKKTKQQSTQSIDQSMIFQVLFRNYAPLVYLSDKIHTYTYTYTNSPQLWSLIGAVIVIKNPNFLFEKQSKY